MVLTTRTSATLFAPEATTPTSSKTLIRLPLSVVPHYEYRCHVTGAIIPTANKPLFRNNLWSTDEHERFLHGLELFPNGPWKEVAKVVGTKSTRQTMSHAQKYRQKIERRMNPKMRKRSKKMASLGMRTAADDFVNPVCLLGGNDGPFVYERVQCAELNEKSTVASPSDFYSDAFDVSHLDHDFDALLNSLEPPLCNGGNHTFTYHTLPPSLVGPLPGFSV